ncbi:MAG TPA: hypothetical protein DCE23_09005 [Firmicutes bacterium]|nr:hypothetical protein [Bacillota bacterium]
MNLLLSYILVKQTFWDQLMDEFKDIGKAISDFFLMIKEVTYDVIAGKVGSDIVNLFLIAIGVIAIIMVCLAIINR